MFTPLTIFMMDKAKANTATLRDRTFLELPHIPTAPRVAGLARLISTLRSTTETWQKKNGSMLKKCNSGKNHKYDHRWEWLLRYSTPEFSHMTPQSTFEREKQKGKRK